jgi:FkbM family methyltransferase
MTAQMDIAVRGARLHVTPFQKSFWAKLDRGKWERGTLDALDRHVRPGVEVLDIGAWVGPVTLYAAARGAARVIAVEADPAAAAALRDNLALNPDLAERVTVVERAVAPAPGVVRLGARRKRGDSMSSVLLGAGPGAWTAPGVTPAELLDMLTPGAPAFVKIDVEGAEYGLADALAPLAGRPTTATLLSFHPQFAAPDRPRWRRTFRLTRRLLNPFAGAQVWRASDGGLRRAWLAEALIRCGLAWYEASAPLLFVRR